MSVSRSSNTTPLGSPPNGLVDKSLEPSASAEQKTNGVNNEAPVQETKTGIRDLM